MGLNISRVSFLDFYLINLSRTRCTVSKRSNKRMSMRRAVYILRYLLFRSIKLYDTESKSVRIMAVKWWARYLALKLMLSC